MVDVALVVDAELEEVAVSPSSVVEAAVDEASSDGMIDGAWAGSMRMVLVRWR